MTSYDPTCGNQGRRGQAGFKAPHGRLFYIVFNRRSHDPRAGRMLGFQGTAVCLEATWGGQGDKVPWEVVEADQWNPCQGEREPWDPLSGPSGRRGACSRQGLFYIINRWKTQDGEVLHQQRSVSG